MISSIENRFSIALLCQPLAPSSHQTGLLSLPAPQTSLLAIRLLLSFACSSLLFTAIHHNTAAVHINPRALKENFN